MSKTKIFCFGFGQVAESFINKLLIEKKDIDLSITTRSETNKFEFNNLVINSYMFNDKKFDSNLQNRLEEANYILISIPPINGEDIVTKYFDKSFNKKKNYKWITYLSATSVYGNHNGEWVNESSETKPTSSFGSDRLNAENSWIDLSAKNKIPLQIFRLAGIYSEKNNILEKLRLGNVKVVDKKNHFFSRVHVEDIANILFESIKNFKSGEIYNISDDRPSSQYEVANYGANLLKIEKPKPIKLDEVESEMLKNFYRDSKKVNNDKMKKFFKYKLKFPTFVEGLKFIKDKNF